MSTIGSTTGKTQFELVAGCPPVIEHEPLGDWYDEEPDEEHDRDIDYDPEEWEDYDD